MTTVIDMAPGNRAFQNRATRTGLQRATGWLARNWIGVTSAVVLLIAWEIGARWVDFPYFPPVSKVVVAFWVLLFNGTILRALATTIFALVAGLAAAIFLGISIGTAMGLSKTVRLGLGPFVDALMSAPMTAFVPLFMLLFGLGFQTRVVVVIVFAFFPIVVNTQAGMMAARDDLLEMARSFGASRSEIFWKVRLPMSYDHIATGLRMGMARGVEGNITGEVLIAAVGIGALVTQYGRSFTTDKLFAVVVVIVLMSFTASKLTEILCRRVMKRAR